MQNIGVEVDPVRPADCPSNRVEPRFTKGQLIVDCGKYSRKLAAEVGVDRVEVRRIVVGEVHIDRNAIKFAESWHITTLRPESLSLYGLNRVKSDAVCTETGVDSGC